MSLDYLDEYDASRGTSFWQHLVAGSVAGLAEHCLIFPLDTIKTHAQCVGTCSTKKADIFCTRAAKNLIQDATVLRLWRGVGAVTIACIPAHASYFGVFESLRGTDVVRNGVAGSLAAVGHDVVMTPADVVKQRLQLGHHNTFRDCVRAISREPGGLLATLYRSFPTTLAMNAPYNCVSVATNEALKDRWRRPGKDLPISTLLLSGGLAGAVASFATAPLDVVKTRLQTQGLARPVLNNVHRWHRQHRRLAFAAHHTKHHLSTASTIKYRGFLDAATSIWRAEGLRGFFRGAAVRALMQAPSVAIVWTTYEFMTASFRNASDL
ncbi:hypothetical protein CTAYLR_007326 [Chrysophaeum taylorii]|uniref:Mitochondrial carrier protein n=1 Tax=Chrysophaeum taylorii TaxID=2483200 RepID=A0AAD7UJW7_9STRA|nr:hypothetical protein CTAYLR_007326 [Chrysophaeum taylorii]